MKKHVLIIDDELSICTFLSLALESQYHMSFVQVPDDAYEIIEKDNVDLVLLDLVLKGASGLDVLKRIKKAHPDIVVIMMTAFGDITSSVEAIRSGAFHYLCKPLNIDELIVYIEQALNYQSLSQQVESLSNDLLQLERRTFYGDIVGSSAQMCKVYQMIDKLKDVNTPVMIIGESGTGKELVARAVHRSGKRRNSSFVSVNCSAIPTGMLEQEFFEAEKPNDPSSPNVMGKIEQANHGTLFLDDVGDMPYPLQGKLLQVLQRDEIYSPTKNARLKTDIRIISSSSKDLRMLIKQGLFREDLYYRLQVFELHMPSLRERKPDIPELCDTILKRTSAERRHSAPTISPKAMRLLMEYDYPGNVRELINTLEYAAILCNGGLIKAEDLPDVFINGYKPSDMTAEKAIANYLSGLSLKDVERLMIKVAIESNANSRRAAAKDLGISERSLFYKLNEYDL